MTNGSLSEQIRSVAREFEAYRETIHPAAKDMLRPTDYFLTKLLLAVAAGGNSFQESSLIRTSMALEFLDQATKLGYLCQTGDAFAGISLLSTDYFYSQAIGQVIELKEPKIIGILAKAIADTAAARTTSDRRPPHLEHLIIAAVELGSLLGGCPNTRLDLAAAIIDSLKEGALPETCDIFECAGLRADFTELTL